MVQMFRDHGDYPIRKQLNRAEIELADTYSSCNNAEVMKTSLRVSVPSHRTTVTYKVLVRKKYFQLTRFNLWCTRRRPSSSSGQDSAYCRYANISMVRIKRLKHNVPMPTIAKQITGKYVHRIFELKLLSFQATKHWMEPVTTPYTILRDIFITTDEQAYNKDWLWRPQKVRSLCIREARILHLSTTL